MRTSPATSRAREIRLRVALQGVVASFFLMGWVGSASASRDLPASPPAETSGPGGVVTLTDTFGADFIAGAGAEEGSTAKLPWVPGELIVRLRPDAGRRVVRTREGGFAAAIPGDSAADALDAVLRRHGAGAFQRIFEVYEDAGGRQIDTADARLRSTREARRARTRRPLPTLRAPAPDLENFFLVEMQAAATAGGMDAVVSELSANDLVAGVQPNYVYRALAEPLPAVPTIPDDPHVSMDGVTWSEGGFGNAFPDLYGLRNLRVLETWSLLDTNGNGEFDGGETAPGEGVVVAVIDSGLDLAHPEMAGRLFVNPGEVPGDAIDNDGNGVVDDVSGWDFVDDDPIPEDRNGHGSHVAGTIVAGANNAEGIVGIAPYARVLPVKGLTDGGLGTTAGLAAAVHYAAIVGADITSNSWGGGATDPALRAAFDFAESSGVLSIAAAGNSGSSRLKEPAAFENVVAIGAVDDVDVLAPFSDWGIELDFCAPGVDVLSLSANDHDNALADATGKTVGDRYLWLSGTSMAAPHASGVAALTMSLNPTESAAEIRGRMMQSAVPIEAQNPGREGGLGAGRVDAFASAVAEPVPLLRLTATRVGAIVEGERAPIDVTLRNFWAPATGVRASLTSSDPDVSVVVGERAFGDMATAEVVSRTFEIEMAPEVELGKEIGLRLSVIADGAPAQEYVVSVRRSLFVNEDYLADLRPVPFVVARATFGDFDADGLQDLGIGSYFEGIRLYRQNSDGTFDDSEPNGSGLGHYPVFADMNGDGLQDLLSIDAFRGGIVLAINVGGGEFEVLPDSSGFRFPPFSPVTSITPIDLDDDGNLDVVAGLFSFFRDDQDISRNIVVLRNNGDLTFSEVWAETGLPRTAGGGQSLTLDWNGDGFQDLLTIQGNAKRVSLHRNLGQGRFEDVTDIAFPDDVLTCADFAAGGCPLFATVAAGDHDNDGDVDLVFTTRGNVFTEEKGSAIVLLANDGKGVFSDVTDRAGDLATVDLLGGSWGTSFFDLENDGDLDLLVPIDIVLIGSPVRTPEPKIVILRNDGSGYFTHVSDVALPPDTPVASSITAVGDYDGDGAQDILAPVSNVPDLVGGLMRNLASEGRAWLAVELDPVESAPNGYGAQVTLEADGRIHTREVRYSPVEPWRVHFGLGDAASVDVVEVRWPSGVVGVQRGVAVDQLLRVDEGTPCPEFVDAECPVVEIDVDPKSEANLLNLQSKKLLTVVILGSESFDAADVDVTRTFFGTGRAVAAHRRGGHLDDVNLDGRLDMISHYRLQGTGIEAGDVAVCLRGQMLDRTPFSGCDEIRTK